MNSSSDDARSLFNKWKQERAKFNVIFKGPSLGFGFNCFVVNVSDKGVVTLAEKEQPSPESMASIVVQFPLLAIASFVATDLEKLDLPGELRFMVKFSAAGTWAFSLKTGERLVMHKELPAS